MTQPTGQPAHQRQENLISVLLLQHVRIRQLFEQVHNAKGDHKREVFDELRELLAVHETAEELVLRPLSRQSAGPQVADARNKEEADATHVLAALEQMDVDTLQFDAKLSDFQQAVSSHAEAEETQEFPTVQAAHTTQELEDLGRKLLAVERVAPTHPHPATAGSPLKQGASAPFTALMDRARDAFANS